MTEISKEALDAHIAMLERQLEDAKRLRESTFGPPEAAMPPIEHERYSDLPTNEAIKAYFAEQNVREGEYRTIYLALLAGNAPLRHTSNPPWAYKKSIKKSIKHGGFALNGKLRPGENFAVGPGDRISLP